MTFATSSAVTGNRLSSSALLARGMGEQPRQDVVTINRFFSDNSRNSILMTP